jgi:hypothetical protein
MMQIAVSRLESLYCTTKTSGAQFRTKCAFGRANFGNAPKKRTFEISRTSEKLLSNIASSNTHLEYEERERTRSA